MKIAYFTPVSPQKTGIADYSEKEVIPYLSRYVDIDIFIDKNVRPNNEYLKGKFNYFSYTDFEKLKNDYDVALYQMGNNRLHEFIYNTLLDYPGITVLHDIYLHGFFRSITLASGYKKRYLDEFYYCYGETGLQTAKNAIKSDLFPEFDYPLLRRILDYSVGVICHSEFGIHKVLKEKPDSICTKIQQPITILQEIDKINLLNIENIRKDLFITDKYPVITSFGFISAHKRYPVIIRTFKEFLKYYPNAVLFLVGEDLMDIQKFVNEMGLKDSVITTGYVSHDRILEYLAISDFCINLRYPTAGETGRSVLQIMAAEKPVIVSNVGWFSELPGECCIKIDVDSFEEDVLLESMKVLAYNEGLREQIGKNALQYVRCEHDPEKVARNYFSFIRSTLNGDEILLHAASCALADLGIEETDSQIISSLALNLIRM
ncbi:glycosyltransferase family 4 protein [Methanocalculus sp.]|uniref:glycosyltransferase family 4 protein n=1 Tax=Methanocalculus sp. TaxID=2004547 RepID=UPI002615946F|nr:glycosyltransferase [Methanocalculus sp.]MDG6249461.1 glycosyltransferase [Methanocalculus sp.]